MILVLLDYIVPVETIDAHRPAHIEWLQQGMASGMLLAAGRQVPLTGGMLICRGDRAAVEAWTKSDPFAVHGLAQYRFTQVEPSLVAPGLEMLRQ